MSLPIQEFRHIAFDNPGAPEVMYMSTAAMPSPADTQVLIRVKAAGVNGPDIAQRKGFYPAPQAASPILGLEVAGEIYAVGKLVSQWKIGDKVCALVPGGGYAEFVLTPASHCLPIPTGWSFAQAAAIPETFFTVWGNLFMRAGLRAGESVLIHGASGGVGSTAILMAKAFGAKVIATTGSDEKCDYCAHLGADAVINYCMQDFVEPVVAFTQGKGVDVVLDMAGGDFINLNLKALAMEGRMVSIAMQRGAQAQIDIFRLMAKRIQWTGSMLRPQSDAAKSLIATQLKQMVWPLLAKGQLQPNIFAQFELADCIAAHQLIESGQHRGKLVLTIT